MGNRKLYALVLLPLLFLIVIVFSSCERPVTPLFTLTLSPTEKQPPTDTKQATTSAIDTSRPPTKSPTHLPSDTPYPPTSSPSRTPSITPYLPTKSPTDSPTNTPVDTDTKTPLPGPPGSPTTMPPSRTPSSSPPPEYSSNPFFSILGVVPNQSVTISTRYFPPNDVFNVMMGPMDTRGIGGVFIGTVDTGDGSSRQFTFNIPEPLQGSYRIAIRMQSQFSGYSAYNWFYNDTEGWTSTPFYQSTPTTKPTSTELPKTTTPTSTNTPIIPATSTPPAIPTPPDLNAILLERLSNLRPGLMAFNPPERMKQARVVRVELRLAPVGHAGEVPPAPRITDVATALTGELEGPGEPVVEAVYIGTIMKAKLAGDGFEITALSEEEQFVTDDTYTEWVWEVKPTKYGERELNLTVTVKVLCAGLGERARDLPVISKTVAVEVDPIYTVSTFAGANWQWLWTAILVPIAGWGWVYYSKKRAERKKKSEQSRQHFE